jgi:hypothetical protein
MQDIAKIQEIMSPPLAVLALDDITFGILAKVAGVAGCPE